MTGMKRILICCLSSAVCVIGSAALASEIPENADNQYGIDFIDNLNGMPEIDSLDNVGTKTPRYDNRFYSESLDFTINMDKFKYVIDSTAKIEVYNSSGALVGTCEGWIGGITDKQTGLIP